jgi:isopentenyl diphosphate isomerase/L-lactate dehydrogenase-like FMN-dependent dehydrogenase
MPTLMNRYPSVPDLEARAYRRIPKFAWDYLAGGAGDEKGLVHNRAVYDRVRFVPDYLPERRAPDTKKTIFGRTYDFPFGVAPVGQTGLIWPRSAEYLAAAAKKANIPFCLSMLATSSIETIGKIAGANAWFQLYPLRDPGVTKSILDRAKAAGFSALLVTVDTPAGRRTLRDQRNGLTVPPRLSLLNIARMFAHPAWLAATAASGMPRFETMMPYYPKDADITGVAALQQTLLARGMDLKGLEAVRKMWDGPMLCKGVMSASDAKDCESIGLNGLVLSNHGGRQSESLVSPLDILPRVRDALGDRLAVTVDSGSRSGLDVARAVALGADFVFMGRAFMFAVCAVGEAGAAHVTELLGIEFAQAMGQIGCFEIKNLPRHLAAQEGAMNAAWPNNRLN